MKHFNPNNPDALCAGGKGNREMEQEKIYQSMFKVSSGADAAKHLMNLIDDTERQIKIWDALAPVFKKWDGKQLNARIKTDCEKALGATWIVSYQAPSKKSGPFGHYQVSLWEKDYNERVSLYLAGAEESVTLEGVQQRHNPWLPLMRGRLKKYKAALEKVVAWGEQILLMKMEFENVVREMQTFECEYIFSERN